MKDRHSWPGGVKWVGGKVIREAHDVEGEFGMRKEAVA